MIRTQVSLDQEMYDKAKDVAERLGISLAELFRRGLAEEIARSRTEQPWMAMAGSLDGEVDDSVSVDEGVYGREGP